jgi:hypothetical protein
VAGAPILGIQAEVVNMSGKAAGALAVSILAIGLIQVCGAMLAPDGESFGRRCPSLRAAADKTVRLGRGDDRHWVEQGDFMLRTYLKIA